MTAGIAELLGVPDEQGEVDRSLVAQSPGDFQELDIGALWGSVETVLQCDDVQPLAYLAAVTAVGGQRLLALTYISLYRIFEIFLACPQKERRKKLGYSSFTQFVDSFSGPQMPPRSTIFFKVNDILTWRQAGCDWDVISKLLSNAPMAGREANTLLIEPQMRTPVIDHDTGTIAEQRELEVDGLPIADYLKSLTTMGPGEARRDVRARAGIPERYVKEAVWIEETKRLLLHAIWDVKDVDILVENVTAEVARWLCEQLHVRLEYVFMEREDEDADSG